MFIAYAIIGVMLAAVLVVSARAKLIKEERVTTGMTGIGVPLGWFPFLAACEIAGALGLLVGLWYAPLGIAAAAGLVLYFIGAAITHLRARDVKGALTPAVVLISPIVLLILRIVTS